MLSFVELQRAHAARADAAHFAWQTRAPYFAATEAALVSHVRALPGQRLLEIGCGEGGNLYHLRSLPASRIGVDFSSAKAAFARQATGAAIAVADAVTLPFADGDFDVVLIRDLLHHLPDRSRALGEARRVLKAGGHLFLVEPNAYSPLILMQIALVRAERGAFASTAKRLSRELANAGFHVQRMMAFQPLPLARTLLHPRLGTAQLGAIPIVARLLDLADAIARRAMPERAWLYLAYDAVRS